MQLLEKLTILADAAKYDVSCSSSGSTRKEIQAPSAPQLNQESVTRLLRMAAVFHC